MKYFKKPNGTIFAYESDGSQDSLIASDLIPITIAEADAIRHPPKTQNEIAIDISEQAKVNLTKLRADVFTDVLSFLSTLPNAPLSIQNAAVMAATEKAKVKS